MSVDNLKREWDASHGTYLTGRSYIDPVDELAAAMERKWGVGRLRLLVDREYTEKFDKQRYKFNQAIQFGNLGDLITECTRMRNAWMRLDQFATGAGAAPLSPKVWETRLRDGAVLAVCPTTADAAGVVAQGRKVRVVTLEEVARLLDHFQDILDIKLVYPGCVVERVGRTAPHDPLDAIDVASGLDVELEGDNVSLFGG